MLTPAMKPLLTSLAALLLAFTAFAQPATQPTPADLRYPIPATDDGLPGAGPITVARLVAEAGDMSRFRSPDAFAALAGVAPIPASSGQIQRMRLNRGGNRQLNRALHVIAVTQSRFHPPAKAYVTRRIEADGKTWLEAIRALKRQLVRPVFKLLVEGAEARLEAA